MKTTIDIPDKVLREALRHTKAPTKREAVVTALEDYNRRQRARQIVAKFGTFRNMLTQKELRQLREARDKRHDRQWHGAR
jgi:Arc/MetJ family transcription regulator